MRATVFGKLQKRADEANASPDQPGSGARVAGLSLEEQVAKLAARGLPVEVIAALVRCRPSTVAKMLDKR